MKLARKMRKTLKKFCDEWELKVDHFVEETWKEKMEREEMIAKTPRNFPSIAMRSRTR